VISLRKANGREIVENPEWKKATFAKAKPASEVLPKFIGAPVAKRLRKPRGRSKTGTARTSISIRLPPDTLAKWKATGPGWQTRMAEALDKAIRRNAA
jgi:uncharacterized protein (DUF4415 family)